MPSATPRHRIAAVLMVASVLLLPTLAGAQSAGSATASSARPAETLLAGRPWEFGPFVNGGFGTGDREAYKFLWAGLHAGKVLTSPFGKGFLNGQFELGAELMPLWQAYTPKYLRANCYAQPGGPLTCSNLFPTGGTYTGVSVTPVILRWNFRSGHRLLPWIQGAGGLIWTNHKFPPIGPYPVPNHLGTSVFNYTPQFGLGVHYFRQAKAVDLPIRECGAYFERQHGRFQSWRERKRTVFHRLYLVEVTWP